MNSTKRLRIFAGPNGSGKSTLVKVVENLHIDLGIYINADNLKISLNSDTYLDFSKLNLILNLENLKVFFQDSSLYKLADGDNLLPCLSVTDNQLFLSNQVSVNDYFTSFLSDYLRNQLLSSCNKFTFETVMSHYSKLEFIQIAKEHGYRIYLYFVALDNPEMAVARVKARVKQGGHDVPIQKIMERYERTMNFLLPAVKLADRSFIFDNSYSEPKMFAVSDNEKISIVNTDFAPAWFQKYVIDKL